MPYDQYSKLGISSITTSKQVAGYQPPTLDEDMDFIPMVEPQQEEAA